jgi:hypothetical protein
VVVVVSSRFGLPISTTHCLVGAVAGIGLLEGRKGFNWLLLLRFLLGWVATVVVAGLTAGVCPLLRHSAGCQLHAIMPCSMPCRQPSAGAPSRSPPHRQPYPACASCPRLPTTQPPPQPPTHSPHSCSRADSPGGVRPLQPRRRPAHPVGGIPREQHCGHLGGKGHTPCSLAGEVGMKG